MRSNYNKWHVFIVVDNMQTTFRVSRTSFFVILAIIFIFTYSGGAEPSPTDPKSHLLIFDTIAAQSAQEIITLTGSSNYAFATSDIEITPVETIRDGGDFELGGPWDVAVYDDDSGIYAIVLARIGDAVQIIDITDPTSPAAVATLHNSTNFEIDDPVDIAIYEGGNGGIYAIITAHNSNTVHIIDITDPTNPVVVAVIQNDDDDDDDDDYALYGASGFTVYEDDSGIYAIVPAHFGDAVQIIDITDPTSPAAVATIRDGDNFELDGPGVVGIYNDEDNGSIYAIVAVYDSNMVQIIDITNPTSPAAVATIRDGDNFELDGPWGIAVYEDDDSAYAMIIARLGNAVQIVDITDPTSPTAVATIRDGENFELDGPADIIVYEDDDDNSYAIVTALNSDAVQVIDISDLTNPVAVATIQDDVDFELDGPTGIAVYEDDSNVYAIITTFHGNAVNIVQINTYTLPTDSADAFNDSPSQETTTQNIEEATKKSDAGGCLIATATYRTELAPQVQTLREVRDNVFLNTELGSAFMLQFNQAYYSFSPAVADAERENEAFRELVKIAIAPAIYTLGIMAYADSEISVLMLGIITILLIAGIYIVVPLLAIRIAVNKVRKSNNTCSHDLNANHTL